MRKKMKTFYRRLTAIVSAGVLAATGTASVMSNVTVSAEDLGLDNYAKLMQYSLYFFDANMCGDAVGENSAFSWRDDCHTEDTAIGGFHDAGDNIKFGQTEGFSASTLGWAYYEFKEQFDKTGVTEHMKVITDYFCDYFKNSTTIVNGEVTNFIYQVDINSDHSTWCAPEGMASRNTIGYNVYEISNGASDIAAQYAASLAQNYINFGDAEDLEYATALYNFATKYRTPAPANENNYNSNEVQDDISWAAGWMYIATGEQQYLEESNRYTSASNWGMHDYMWQNSGLGAAIINAEITGNWSNATSYIDGKVNSSMNRYYLYNSWGSARHNTLMQFCALVCTKYSDQSNKDYSSWAKQQMNYILGDNSANTCFVVGYNSISATSPHHRAASNITISPDWHEYNNWDGKYSSSGGHILYGALVGGPYDTNFGYNDNAKDATSNEVAIDYQVGLVGAAAALYATFGTGSVVAEIGEEVTVYASEVAAANGETPITPDQTTTITTETTSTTEETTTTENVNTTTTENTTASTVEETSSTTSIPQETTTTTITVSETTTETVKIFYGDVNLDGRVDITDAVHLNKKLADVVQLNENALQNADCNADGNVDINDAGTLLRFLVGILDSLGKTA